MTEHPHRYAPTSSENSDLEPTHIRCIEDGTVTPVDDPDEWMYCPEQEEGEDHPVEYLHITSEPLGYLDDDDFKVPSRPGTPAEWHYPAIEP